MDSNYEGRRKVLSILSKVVQAAKDLGLKELASLAMTVIKIKGKMEGSATAMKEHMADAINASKELQDYIKGDEKLAEKVRKGNYDPGTVSALFKDLEGKISASFLKTKEQESRIGKLEMERDSLDTKRDDEIAAAKERLDAAKSELEEAKAAVVEAEKNAKDASKVVGKTNMTKLYKEAMAAAKKYTADDLMRSENPDAKKDEKPEAKPESKPSPKDEKKPDTKKAPGIGDINKMIKDKDKKPEPKPAKTSLDGVAVTAADSEVALESALSEIQSAEKEISDSVSAFASALENVDSMVDSAVGGLEEAVAMVEAAPDAESEGDEEPAAEAPAEEGPGMMDKIKDFFTPAPQMEMAPAMTSIENPWFAESSLEATADVKTFPSEFDQSSGHFEIVEGDNGKKLTVKKDLKSKVQRKIKEAMAGKYNEGDAVAVDLGDRIVAAVIKQYASEGVYEVVSEGRVLRVPDANVFKSAEDIWR